MVNLIQLVSETPSKSPRLEEAEVKHVFAFLFEIHDHSAKTAAQSLYWVRESEADQYPAGRN